MTAAGAGRGRLRASHADRDQAIDVLKTAFVQGRLTKDEFDTRVGQTFTSRTYAELAVVTADIPAGLTEARPQRNPRRHASRQAVAWSTGVIIAVVVLVVAGLIGNGQVTYVAVSAVFGAGFVAVAQTLYSRQQRRFGGSPGASAARRGTRGQVRALASRRPSGLRRGRAGPGALQHAVRSVRSSGR
jgi:energy-converting hydrogenase Eha subunit A